MNKKTAIIFQKFCHKIKRKLSNYKKLRQNRKELIRLMFMYRSYLLDGEYKLRFFVGKPVIVLNCDKSMKLTGDKHFAVDLPATKNRRVQLVKKKFVYMIMTFGKKIILHDVNTEKLFEGSILLLTASKSVKIFDLQKKLILTFSSVSKYYEANKKASDVFSKYFNLAILDFDDKKRTYYEKFISYDICDKFYGSDYFLIIMEGILKGYLGYFDQIKEDYQSISINKILSGLKSESIIPTNFLNSLTEVIDKYKTCDSIPLVYQHGDLYRDNIIISDGECYLIDLDRFNKRIFFYDIFAFMISTIIHGNSCSLLLSYCHGDYDYYFEKLFDFFPMKYEREKKSYYVSLYSLQDLYICIEFCTDTVSLHRAIKKRGDEIIKMIKTIESYKSTVSE